MDKWVQRASGRADNAKTFNMTGFPPIAQQTTAQWNRTRTLINDLLLAKSQALRTMHIALGAFSMALSALMILRILNDSRRVAKLQVSLRPRWYTFLTQIHPADTFPLVLAISIFIQQVIFVAVQSTALDSVLVSNCRSAAQVVFPAIFLFGYTTLVFSMETAIRGLRRKRFQPRGRYNTIICVVIIIALLLSTWIPTAVWPARRRCFGSLIWYPFRFSVIAIGILSSMLFLCIVLTMTIALQLLKSVHVDDAERIAASRMFYYLILVTITYALVLPFFVQAHSSTSNAKMTTSRLAEVPLFCTGIAASFMHLILRVNASRMALRPAGAPRDGKKQHFRFFGPSDLEITISQPIMADKINLLEEDKKNCGDLEYAYANEKPPLSPTKSLPVDVSRWPSPPSMGNETLTESNHKRNKPSYSLFPTRAEEIPRLPATVYTPPSKPKFQGSFGRKNAMSVTDVHEASLGMKLDLPAPFFSRPHRRERSAESCATVQIGLRLSVAPAVIAAAQCTEAVRAVTSPIVRSPLRRDLSDSSGETLGLPIQVPTPELEASNSNAPASTSTTSKFLQIPKNKILPPTPRAFCLTTKPSAVSGLRMNPVSPPPSSPGGKRSSPPNKPAPGWI